MVSRKLISPDSPQHHVAYQVNLRFAGSEVTTVNICEQDILKRVDANQFKLSEWQLVSCGDFFHCFYLSLFVALLAVWLKIFSPSFFYRESSGIRQIYKILTQNAGSLEILGKINRPIDTQTTRNPSVWDGRNIYLSLLVPEKRMTILICMRKMLVRKRNLKRKLRWEKSGARW